MKSLRCGVSALIVSGPIFLFGGVWASAQSFQLSQNGKSVGSASLALKQSPGGVTSTSGAKVDMPGLKYSFSENATLDAGYHLKNVELSGSVNGTSASVSGTSVSGGQGQQFAMKINANGKVTTTPLMFHAQAIFFPDFDPGALQAMLNLGAAHNNRDLWALIPKQAGSVDALRVATKADEQGSLDGQAMAVHHVTVTDSTETIEVFSGPANQLLQAEWTSEGFAMVRQGFVMKPPAKPSSAPPAKQPADAGQGAGTGTAPAPQPQQ